jgi:hypothetical protein
MIGILPVVIALHTSPASWGSGGQTKCLGRQADRADFIGFFILINLNLLKRLHEAFFQLVRANSFLSDFAQSNDWIFIPITINGQFSATRDFARTLGGE